MTKRSSEVIDGSELRLAAFAFADVEGYTRHIEADNLRAVRKWAELRNDILLGELPRYKGRLVSSSGDAVLLEFSGAVNALQWALHVQLRIQEMPESKDKMLVRIGINIDDVIDDGNSLQSDGVVIASRIQDLAAAGEVVLTQQVKDIVRNRVDVSYRDLGAPQLKNISRPVRVFAVENAATDRTVIRPYTHWESRPSLAVLPFKDLMASEEEQYFGEGMTEDIVTGVSRSRAMFVVARASTLKFAGGDLSSGEIANALGVSYLLTGSVRRQGKKLRIHTELVDVARNRAVWADNYDGENSDLFEFQDRIVSSIVAALEPRVELAEAANLGSRPTDSLDAYDCVLRAIQELYRFEGASYTSALKLLERAVSLDPDYARAHTYLAWCLNFWIAEELSTDLLKDREKAIAHARRGVQLDPEDALGLSVRGHLLSVAEKRPHEGLDLLDQALLLNENLPMAWGASATAHAYVGNAKEARERLKNVWRLTPFDPLNFFFWTASGLVEFVDGQYGEAVRSLQKARRTKPHFTAALRLLAASLALDGRREEARKIAEKLLVEDPGFSISNFMAWYPLDTPDSKDRLARGLRESGLPD